MTVDLPQPEHPLAGAHLDFSRDMSYGDYLGLDAILSAQRPLSQSHNEMLFIVQHQTSELWLKLALHELLAARAAIRRDDISPALKMLARVSRLLEHLTGAWTILSTLTPSEYGEFRAALGRSSGFQSHQYRMLEFVLGNKNPVMMRPHQHHPERLRAVLELLHAPSLYDEVARLLARRGFSLDSSCLERDWTEPYRPNSSLEAVWRAIYADPPATGIFTSSARSWSTSKTASANGAIATRRRWSALSATSAAPAVPRAWPI